MAYENKVQIVLEARDLASAAFAQVAVAAEQLAVASRAALGQLAAAGAQAAAGMANVAQQAMAAAQNAAGLAAASVQAGAAQAGLAANVAASGGQMDQAQAAAAGLTGRLQQLYTESIEQYFRDMSEFLNGDPDELSTSARSKDNAQMSLYALAVTMHKVNSLAVPHARDGKMISMLDLVKEGLLINNQINNGLIEESMSPSYVQKLLVNKSKAIHLLRLRSNFLPTMVLAKISNIQKKGLKGIITRLGMRLWSWKLDTTKLDLLQILEYTEWLKAANSARDYLGKELKIDSKIDKSIMHIYENMEFIPEDSAPKDKTTPEQRKAQALRNNALRSLTLEINKLSIKR